MVTPDTAGQADTGAPSPRWQRFGPTVQQPSDTLTNPTMNQIIAISAHEVTSMAHGVTHDDDMEPINGISASYGVFRISGGINQPVSTWRTALFGPVQMIASSTDRHSAAIAAIMHLVAMNEVGLALVVRNRDAGKNEALIRWTETCGPAGCYRFSSESWV